MELYKYVPPARLDILWNCEVGFPTADFFNDPFETKPLFERIMPETNVEDTFRNSIHQQLTAEKPTESAMEMRRQAIARLKTTQPELVATDGCILDGAITEAVLDILKVKHWDGVERFFALSDPTIHDYFRDLITAMLSPQLGILSLSETAESILMWAHYSESHSGFVLGFNSGHDFFQLKGHNNFPVGIVKRVNYQSARPKFPGMPPQPTTGDLVAFANHILLNKSSDWSYEREWRLVNFVSHATRHLYVRNRKLALFKLPPSALKSITIGARTEPHVVQSIRHALQDSELRHVELRQASLSSSRYAVQIEPAA